MAAFEELHTHSSTPIMNEYNGKEEAEEEEGKDVNADVPVLADEMNIPPGIQHKLYEEDQGLRAALSLEASNSRANNQDRSPGCDINKPPTRSQFLQSTFYRCALAFNRNEEERLKNIRELLEKVNQANRYRQQTNKRKRYASSWKFPDDGDGAVVGGNKSGENEDSIILSANKEGIEWVEDESGGGKALIVGGLTVMKVPGDMFNRLKPYQRDAVKWFAFAGPIGGILADEMGLGKTVRVYA